MQLKKIKLSGFKSFVDPITVPVPGNLVAIVGPNGCGKSNIIDAVCWVMGESSAKYLRGESLTDVIFNGSSARKPVGQASVELIFDNQDGSLGGEYASYAEISIRRLINRESESSYFLNGARCRRRDIVGIFLGTGLGPRSYSIIGQNMISRIIEAKPDDMRVYLEEAAGVSKYKERRRETENRINHTKENMARLDDVRAELEKQLANLKRQANAAEKFKTLKQEERMTRAKWLASQWRQYDSKLVQYSLQIQQQETALEARNAELSENQLNTNKLRDDHGLANEAFQEVQHRYYKAGNEITRIEQEIHHTKERAEQRQADVLQTQHDWTEVKNSLADAENELNELMDEVEKLEPAFEKATETVNKKTAVYHQAEEAMQAWQEQWDAFNTHSSKTTRIAEVEQTRIIHLEQRLASLKQRKKQFTEEKNQIHFVDLEKEIAHGLERFQKSDAVLTEQNQKLTDLNEVIVNLEKDQQKLMQKLDEVHSEAQDVRGKHTSLQALQQVALGQQDERSNEWLNQHQLDQLPRLAQHIHVQTGWEEAVEKVLGVYLQAVCVDSLSLLTEVADKFTAGNLSAFASSKGSSSLTAQKKLLLHKIESPWPLDGLLAGVYAAETYQEACQLYKTLAPYESVITAQGVWLGASWLRISRDENQQESVLKREKELKQLAKQLMQLEKNQEKLSHDLVRNRAELKNLLHERDELQKKVNQSYAEAAQLKAEQNVKQERLVELNVRANRLQKELIEVLEQDKNAEQELANARSTWQKAMDELQTLADQRDALMQKRETFRLNVQMSREHLDDSKEEYHQLEIRLQTTKSQQTSLKHSIQRMEAQLKTLAERREVLETHITDEASLAELENALATALSYRLQIEDELNHARVVIEEINHQLRAMEDARHGVEREIAAVRDMLETLRLENQSIKVKIETIVEQLHEAHFEIEEILTDLSDEALPENYQQELEQITLRITRLGAINLVAIEEHEACNERKEYLDKQYADLLEGLTTLQNAIDKIDKETRARFKETFNKVNERFQELFPKVFGGGHASLELMGENLLDAGITVMACPPGKRNSTIHLLSGGEKAMTAIALVFSIFHLNPAPFCLLDEVDAPLDDANIGRFCQLVKVMSEKTQFIFISHNKLAIEMSDHLMGVTMHEPGVSRLVSVNMEEAVSLAGA
ncbi:MAG: hypothetical protein ACD_60C00044G0010 [uncultured bacterium]|nr:MAG: hypothetical protein ACD_60C00044G0010 [uncultured bacterium]